MWPPKHNFADLQPWITGFLSLQVVTSSTNMWLFYLNVLQGRGGDIYPEIKLKTAAQIRRLELGGVRSPGFGSTDWVWLPSGGRFSALHVWSFITEGHKYWTQTVSSAKEANLFISVIVSTILVSLLRLLAVYSHLGNNSVSNSTSFRLVHPPSSSCDQSRWQCTGNTRTTENIQILNPQQNTD